MISSAKPPPAFLEDREKSETRKFDSFDFSFVRFIIETPFQLSL
jgi:hypothetical protein